MSEGTKLLKTAEITEPQEVDTILLSRSLGMYRAVTACEDGVYTVEDFGASLGIVDDLKSLSFRCLPFSKKLTLEEIQVSYVLVL